MKTKKLIKILEKNYGWENLKEDEWFVKSLLKDTIDVFKKLDKL